MKIILTEKRELVTKNGKKGYVINGTFIPLDDKRQDGKNDGIPEVTGGNKGAQGTQKDNSGVTTVTPGAQGTQTNKGAQDNSDEDEGSEVARTGKYSTDSQGRDYDDPEYGQPAKKVEPTNQGAQGTQKVVTPKITTKSGKELPKQREVKKGSTRERMINKNVEIHGADKIINLRNKNAAFQATRKKGSGYSMDDFVKDFPDSNAAKDRRKSKKIAPPGWDESYDAFDIVSAYLIDSNQVENMDEALYVMTEMDAQTIQGIVEDFKKKA